MRAAGNRITTSRRVLIAELLDLQGPITAEELCALVQEKAPDNTISTIYRKLEGLARLGVIVHSHLGHGPAVHQLASTAQAHLVCNECGTILEAPGELFVELTEKAGGALRLHCGPSPLRHPGSLPRLVRRFSNRPREPSTPQSAGHEQAFAAKSWQCEPAQLQPPRFL